MMRVSQFDGIFKMNFGRRWLEGGARFSKTRLDWKYACLFTVKKDAQSRSWVDFDWVSLFLSYICLAF